jgi:hypothetical protein
VIIYFSPDIKIYGWISSVSLGGATEHHIRVLETSDQRYLTAVRIIQLLNFENKYPIVFENQLKFLQQYIPAVIVGDLDFAKNYVDDFLIRMSKLRAFL